LKITISIICISAAVLFIGRQWGISSEMNRQKVSVIRFDGQVKSIAINEIKTFNAMSSGRMRTYVLMRGKFSIENDNKTLKLDLKNESDFLHTLKIYYGIDDDQTIMNIAQNYGRWFVIENLSGKRILYSDEKEMAFAELEM